MKKYMNSILKNIFFIVCYKTFSYKCMFYLYMDIKLIKKY
jgi:hypothetical protein